MRASVTRASGVAPSKVADLMTRLRRATGPSFAGAKTSGAGARSVGARAAAATAVLLAFGWGDAECADHRPIRLRTPEATDVAVFRSGIDSKEADGGRRHEDHCR